MKKEWTVSTKIEEELEFVPEVVKKDECEAVGLEKREFAGFWEHVIQSKCEKDDSGIQTTVIINKVTKKPTLIDAHKIDITITEKAPVIPEEIIPESKFVATVQKDPTLQAMIAFINKKNPALVGKNPSNTVMESLGESKIVTMIFEIKEEKERVVVVHSPKQ